MKISAKCNMYERTLRETQALFASHIAGEPDNPVCLLSDRPLSETATTALVKSAEQLGYGTRACFAVVLTDDAGETLDPEGLFHLLEGIDPAVTIAADKIATQALELTYNTKIEPLAYQHVFGRPTLAFNSFENMLNSADAKQKAWSALKLLKRS